MAPYCPAGSSEANCTVLVYEMRGEKKDPSIGRLKDSYGLLPPKMRLISKIYAEAADITLALGPTHPVSQAYDVVIHSSVKTFFLISTEGMAVMANLFGCYPNMRII
jgi:hypothetical protein